MKGKAIPESLMAALHPVTVIVGHYGTGKTNLAVNIAIDLARAGKPTTLIDLDVVNPYFRASEQRSVLENAGVDLIAPVFAEAGTSLDVPSLTGRIQPAIDGAHEGAYTIIDAGGDDVGATALGRFSRPIASQDHAMFCVLNRYRNLVQDPVDAVDNLREIEVASRLKVTGLISNAHMKLETDTSHFVSGLEYAHEVSKLSGIPLRAFTYPDLPAFDSFESSDMHARLSQGADYGSKLSSYCVELLVRTPWESM